MQVARQFGLNWFTTVMGIGIVTALTYTSPYAFPWQHQIGAILFGLLNVVFIASLGLWLVRWLRHPDAARADFQDPKRVLFYGAFAMAINVVGNSYFLIATHLFNPLTALAISKGLWVVGTLVSILTVTVVPYLLFVKHQVEMKDTLATWLIPVVPPIVAAATGTNLIPYWGPSGVQFALTVLIIAMLGVTFFLFLMISSLVYSRLVYHQRLSGEVTPSLWVEIGPIGMAMATLSTLPLKSQAIFAPYLGVLHMVGIILSMALWGIGLWWIVISSLYSLWHLTRNGDGLNFNLGWWSYVFPIGSFTTGTYALGHLTNTPFFVIAGFIQLLLLWFFFSLVFGRTLFTVVLPALRFRRDREKALRSSQGVLWPKSGPAV